MQVLTSSLMPRSHQHILPMMHFFILLSWSCFFMLFHVVFSSAEFITQDVAASSSTHLSSSTDQVVGDSDDASISTSLAKSLRDIVNRHLQQQDSTTTSTVTANSTTAPGTTSSTSSYSFLQLCHKISNLPNLECECTPLVEQWQEAQQERKELDETYVIFDKIELQKIKCESTNPICSSDATSTTSTNTSSSTNSSNNINNDTDVTCGRFTLDVVTANSSHDLSSRISQTTFRSCIMYTRMPSSNQLEQPYLDGCVQWEYYITSSTMSNSSSSSSEQQEQDEASEQQDQQQQQQQQSTALQVLEQENCHVSFMNMATGTMEKCTACQVCYTDNKQQRGMNVDCDNVEPAASTTAITITSTTSATNTASSTVTVCHVLDLDSFFPGFRPKQEHHFDKQQQQQQQPPPQTRPTSASSSSSPEYRVSLLFSMLLIISNIFES